MGLDSTGAVVRLRGRVFGEETQGADYIGVLALGDALRARLPTEGCLVADGLIPWLAGGGRVATLMHETGFRDTGTLGEYLEANLAWLGGRRAFVAPAANVESSVALDRSIVLDGATVAGSGALVECLVWPGANASAPLVRAIVTQRGVVEVSL